MPLLDPLPEFPTKSIAAALLPVVASVVTLSGCSNAINNPPPDQSTQRPAKVAPVEKRQEPTKSDQHEKGLIDKPSAAAGPNEKLTAAAWDAFNAGNYQEAITLADKCIGKFKELADKLEEKLERDHVSVPLGAVSDEQKARIHANGILNDVATCYFLKGSSADSLGNKDEAVQAYRACERYPHARCWDPQGWFWSPAEGAKKRL